MSGAVVTKKRCAIYTRKSSEERLDQEFNSLDAQREACAAYVASQKSEGWTLVPDRYDDGGWSGGNLERPALQRLLADIAMGRVDVVVCYKIDRLSRSLMDFAKLVEAFDRRQVTFVSVTQSFNTTTSMGRLTLNVLLSFAQFEREVTAERIRDKFAASRARGMWMGGWAPLGYDVRDRKLQANETEAETVRMIFDRFAKLGSITGLVRELKDRGVQSKRGRPDRQGLAADDPEEPGLHRRGGPQGHEPSRRARSDPVPDPVGQGAGSVHAQSAGEGGGEPRRHAGAAAGPDLRRGRPGDVSQPHEAQRAGSTATTSASRC